MGIKLKPVNFSVVVLAAMTLVVTGCGKDDPAAPEAVGTVAVDQTPDELVEAGWTLTGPQDESGAGDLTLSEMPIGEYTLVWDDATGYTTPPQDTQTLEDGETITFSGSYLELGTITIDQTPDALPGASWTLSGPQNDSGSGDATLPAMPTGDYVLTWGDVAEYITPAATALTLDPGGTIAFSGEYVESPADPEFVTIAAGTFVMGSPSLEAERRLDEPQHTVTLTRSFQMLKTEVTNHQYREMVQWAYDLGYCTANDTTVRDALDGSTQELLDLNGTACEIAFADGAFVVDIDRADHPVKEVSWFGAAAYCDWLSMQAELDRAYDHGSWQCNGGDPYSAQGYRLPTEAEWEYACRAGTQTPFNTGDCLDAGTEANYDGSYPYTDCPSGPSEGWTVEVASYPANSWDLHDTHGNLMEWCNDWWGEYGGDATDPVGGPVGSHRVYRGGYWFNHAQFCRSAIRFTFLPNKSNELLGFRPVRTADAAR